MCATRKRKLPIGIQTFREIREEGHYYVDKTQFAGQLVDEGKHYFLARPRRFGKSLLIDTLKELFEGNKALFRGLAIYDGWDWAVRYPVVRLSFGSGSFLGPGQLAEEALIRLDNIAEDAGLASAHNTGPARLRHLLRALHRQTGQRVAVLVDEYDKPILDALGTPEMARANRDYLRGLYSTIKDCDEHVKFTFLTGVSKFSKVNLFSGLNNLTDITLDPRYSAICGYTDADLDTTFTPELPGFDRAAIRDWYNGYSWLGEEKVYNPFDVLQLFRGGVFKAHWFETGSPTFLIDLLLDRGVATMSLDGLVTTDDLLSSFDVDRIATEALLFQTGYLTITNAESKHGRWRYRLGYPNLVVRQSLNEHLLRELLPNPDGTLAQGDRLHELLRANDFAGMETLFRSFFASIPYNWHVNNDIARFEGYYASVFYSHFAAAGLDVRVEDATSHGRVDMAVRFNGNVYLFEFKVVELGGDGAAMAQLKDRRYADKYRHLGEPIHLVAVEFSQQARNVAAFAVEQAA